MTLADYINRKVPDYYPSMYLDGYTPEEILSAKRKAMLEELTEQDDTPEIRIVSEVKRK